VLVLVHLLSVVRKQHPGDKVVVVSNYTEALDVLQKVRSSLHNSHSSKPVKNCRPAHMLKACY
jgi:hypothetical protein